MPTTPTVDPTQPVQATTPTVDPNPTYDRFINPGGPAGASDPASACQVRGCRSGTCCTPKTWLLWHCIALLTHGISQVAAPGSESSPASSYPTAQLTCRPCHPPPTQSAGDGLHAAPWSCAQFLNCGGGTGGAMDCPPGTLWDDSAKTCNFADQVDCGGRPR